MTPRTEDQEERTLTDSLLGPLANLRIMVVNDDGIDAPGLALLTRAARTYCPDVWVVAPATNQSAKSRSMSFRSEVAVESLEPRTLAVHGTPVDCALVGLNGLIPGRRPDLVLSGVNSGGNLADDVGFSGTVGACLESAQEGVPAIAFSQLRAGPKLVKPNPVDWTCAEALCASLLPGLVAAISEPRTVLNVNFPAVSSPQALKGLIVTHCGWRDAPTLVEERPRAGDRRIFMIAPLRDNVANESECDLGRAEDGCVTVTPVTLDATDHGGLPATREALRHIEVDRCWQQGEGAS